MNRKKFGFTLTLPKSCPLKTKGNLKTLLSFSFAHLIRITFRTQRDCFLQIFSTFGFILDFYIPLSIESEVSYCFIEYKESRNAYTACRLFDGTTSLEDLETIVIPLVTSDLRAR